MRFLAGAALAAIIALLTHAPAHTPAPHTGGVVYAAAAASGPTLAGRGSLRPAWFGSGWWKKLKRVLSRVLEFIDGLIDDLRSHPGDDGGSGGGGSAGLIPSAGPGAFVRIAPRGAPAGAGLLPAA